MALLLRNAAKAVKYSSRAHLGEAKGLQALSISRALSQNLKSSSANLKRSSSAQVQINQMNQTETARKTVHVKALRADNQSSYITVDLLNDGNVVRGKYPSIFLRDICRCNQCWQKSFRQRSINLFSEVDRHIQADKVTLLPNGEVSIQWNDGHESKFSAEFLFERKLPQNPEDTKRGGIAGLDHIKKKLWGSEMQDHIPRVKFDKVISDDHELYKWLTHVLEEGICIIEDAPLEKDQLKRLADRVQAYRGTYFGDVFTISMKPDPMTIAYTSSWLSLHSDLPYFSYNPCVQLLHCVVQCENGGENELVDGFHVAQQLKKEHPAMFDLLTKQPVRYHDMVNDEGHGEFNFQTDRPLIGTDRYGNVTELLHSNVARGSYIDAPAETVKKVYEAMYTLYDLMYDKRNAFTQKIKGGEILVFDNHRVLHGRRPYSHNEHRELHGSFMDYDEIHSRLRVLHEKLYSNVTTQ